MVGRSDGPGWSALRAVVAGAGSLVLGAAPVAALSSYPVEALDAPGSSTGAAAVALGVPDYHFVNDAALAYGGTNADVFAPGEATVLRFPFPLRNVPGQIDLLVSALVGGAGATDAAVVDVEVSSDGTIFTSAGSIDTRTGRDPFVFPPQEAPFESVKHFPIEFGAADLVTHVRLTNTLGTAEGFRLDAVEGLYPAIGATHAFELRVDRYRQATTGRFRLRIKNLANPGGVAIRELRIERGLDSSRLEDTQHALPALYGSDGALVCVENCNTDNAPVVIPFSRHAWSLDGLVEAPMGIGLDPGRQVATFRNANGSFDTDPAPIDPFLQGFSFHIAFTDDTEQSLDFEDDVVGNGVPGALYQKYQYFVDDPVVSEPLRTDTYEFSVPEPDATVLGATALAALALARRPRRSVRPRVSA